MDLDDIERIVKILKQSDVTDFELERDGTRIRLTRSTGGKAFVSASENQYIEPAIHTQLGTVSQTAAKEVIVADNLVSVPSPIVGTFYRKPSPDAEPFVKEGTRVKKGDTLCIIEAMKLMNEIESPSGGVIEKIFLSDGQVVEYNEVLFLINPER